MNETLKDQALLLVRDMTIRQKMVGALESLSYQDVTLSSITENTLEQIKSVPYKVIVLEDGFQNIPLVENPIYREIVRMAMSLRRNTFLVLLGKEMKHLGSMEAFSMSANLLLDAEKMGEEELVTILRQEISRYAQFYQVYNRAREQISQGI